jgi:hypothetical protein
MNSRLLGAAGTVMPYWRWILFLGVAAVFGSNRIWPEFSFPILIVVFAVTIFIYGRIVSDIVSGYTPGARRIMLENWLNYLIVVLIVGVPQGVFRVLVAGRLDSWLEYVFFTTILGSVLSVLTIYALPIAFLKKSNLGAVLAGVVYLSRNMAVSGWIAGVVVIANVFGTVGAIVFRVETTPWSFVLALSTAVFGLSISYVAFAGALRVLVHDDELESSLHA